MTTSYDYNGISKGDYVLVIDSPHKRDVPAGNIYQVDYTGNGLIWINVGWRTKGGYKPYRFIKLPKLLAWYVLLNRNNK